MQFIYSQSLYSRILACSLFKRIADKFRLSETYFSLLSFISVPASVFVSPPEVYRLSLGQKNVSFLCFGHGYPIPRIVWKKDGNPIVYPIVSQNLSAINSSKRLEVKADGVTYEEAGKYTCEVYNGVDGMTAASATLEVLCKYTFPSIFSVKISYST